MLLPTKRRTGRDPIENPIETPTDGDDRKATNKHPAERAVGQVNNTLGTFLVPVERRKAYSLTKNSFFRPAGVSAFHLVRSCSRASGGRDDIASLKKSSYGIYRAGLGSTKRK